MLVDLAAFSAEGFDPKAWINSACGSRPPEEGPEKYLTELEMKLQLLSEDISAGLEEQSSAALLRVPRAARETNRVKDDAVSLKGTVAAILQRLEQAETSSAASVAALAQVDGAKRKLEEARDTLEYAAGLAQLSATVDDVFSSGDLPKVADTLSSMRRCMAVVGEVPEFADMKTTLASLEDRLEQMVQPRLTDALNQRKAEAALSLRDILLAIDRGSSLESTFCRVRARPLRRLWEEFDGAPPSPGGTPPGSASLAAPPGASFSEWLPRFYDEVLIATEQEMRWCAAAFPGDAVVLVPRLLTSTLNSIKPSFEVRIEAELAAAAAGPGGGSAQQVAAGGGTPLTEGGANGGSKLALLLNLHSTTGSFARNLQRVVAADAVPPTALAAMVKGAYAPYEQYKQQYGEMEKENLQVVISAIDLKGAVLRGFGQRGFELSAAVRRMESSVPIALAAFESAIDRCFAFTGGSECEDLVMALDDMLPLYISRLLDCLKSLRPVCGLPTQAPHKLGSAVGEAQGTPGVPGKDAEKGSREQAEVGEDEEEWSVIQGALQLLTVAESLGTRASVFEASLRVGIVRLAGKVVHDAMLACQQGGAGAEGDGAEAEAGLGEPKGPLSAPLAFSHSSSSFSQDLDIAVLRLADDPSKTLRLRSLLDNAQDPRFHALPRGAQRVQAFRDAVSSLVFDVLLAKVRRQLTNVAYMPEWAAKEEENVFDLPSFSAYPLLYITSIGEYLLTLPQQLEPLAVAAAEVARGQAGLTSEDAAAGAEGGGTAGGVDDAGGYFVREWMMKVAEGAISMYMEQLKGIPSLSERGAQQLAADIEYLNSVLSVLYVDPSAALSTFQLCLTTTKDQLAGLIAEEGNTLDVPTTRLVAKMRGVPLDKSG